MSDRIQQQRRLPFSKAVRIAWKNIRIRWMRSLLVTSGIILALAFLMYILASEGLSQSIRDKGSREMIEDLVKKGALSVQEDLGEAKAQTWWMVGLALLISFVGILNAMIMSVTERFREIGTMKCLGAPDAFIIKLYLLESLFQGMVGTAIGVVVGLILALLEGFSSFGVAAMRLQSVGDLARVALICLICGIVLTIAGALYPAWRAAKMEPVAAMRSEV
jgi:ABC-type lipoprotein release transport system permease subunit